MTRRIEFLTCNRDAIASHLDAVTEATERTRTAASLQNAKAGLA